MLVPVLALLLALTSPGDGHVRGRVVDPRTDAGVIGAEVRLTGPGLVRVARTSRTGEYEFPDVVAGEYRIHVTHPGYEPADIRVVLTGESAVYVDVPLLLRPVELAPIIARALRTPRPTRGDPSPEAHPPRSIANTYANRLTPRSASPLSDMVAPASEHGAPHEPGGQHDHVLYFWGSGTDRGRVFVDGATLNAPLHMGGLLAALDPELMRSTDLRSGGSSVRFDGGATYIMDYVTRDASVESAKTAGEFDPIATRLFFDAPLFGNAGIMVGARRVNSEIVDLLMDGPFGYGYADVLVRANGELGTAGLVRATAIATRERIDVPRDQDVDDASWRNLAISLGWRDRAGPSYFSLQGTYSRGTANLPLLSAPGGHMIATVERRSLSAERQWMHTRIGGVLGMEAEHLRFDRVSRAERAPFATEFESPVSCTTGLPCFGTTTGSVAGYGDLTWQPSARFSARAGLRMAYRPLTRTWDALPRVSFTSTLGQHTAVTLAAGRYSQPFAALSISPEDVQLTMQQVQGDIHAIAEVAYANQIELNVVRSTEPSSIAATVYVRHHEAGNGGEQRVIPGADVTWSYSIEGVSASLGYSLVVDPSASDTSRTALGRHLATASLGAAFGPMDLHVSGAFGHGLPFTSIVLEHGPRTVSPATVAGPAPEFDTRASVTESPDRPYFRLDAELSARWTTERRQRQITVAPYAKLVNALSHRDAMFYYYDRGIDAEPRPLARLAAVPVLGIRWEF